jgi:type II restriction enzyme
MGINIDKPHKWKADIRLSVDMYNDWFMNFAPEAFRNTRTKTTEAVIDTLSKTAYLKNISSEIIKKFPEILPTLRMSTCPPIAIDRLIGLSNVSPNLVKTIEIKKKIPERMKNQSAISDLNKICDVINKLLDKDIFPWLLDQTKLNDEDVKRASTIIADRLCGSITNPIIRNAQEKRQLNSIQKWLEEKGYKRIEENSKISFEELSPGTFAYHYNIQVKLGTTNSFVNIPIDVVVKPKDKNRRPLLIEAKSAGDFTNVNKRRKEEAQKMSQIKETYANKVTFILFLCGYFDSGYLGYEAAEGIDWIWEHSISDLSYYLGN